MEIVLAAAVTALGAVLVAVITSFKEVRALRRENEMQHAVNKLAAERNSEAVISEIRGIDKKLDAHIAWHAHQTPVQPILKIVKENLE